MAKRKAKADKEANEEAEIAKAAAAASQARKDAVIKKSHGIEEKTADEVKAEEVEDTKSQAIAANPEPKPKTPMEVAVKKKMKELADTEKEVVDAKKLAD